VTFVKVKSFNIYVIFGEQILGLIFGKIEWVGRFFPHFNYDLNLKVAISACLRLNLQTIYLIILSFWQIFIFDLLDA